MMTIHTIENESDLCDLKEFIQEQGYKSITLDTILENITDKAIIQLRTPCNTAFKIFQGNFTKEQAKQIREWVVGLSNPPKDTVEPLQNHQEDNKLVHNSLVFGKDITQNVVSIECVDNIAYVFQESPSGVSESIVENKYWILSDRAQGPTWKRLEGNLTYKFIKYYTSREEWAKDRKILSRQKQNIYSLYDEKEAFMVLNGLTYFKGMKVSDVSILSCDIETTGLDPNAEDAKVLIISNTFRCDGEIERVLFCYDEYSSQKAMIEAWCTWVRKVDPSIINFYNGFLYDWQYIKAVADSSGATLMLGRDGSELRFNDYTSEFRYDGSMFYEYYRCFAFGREIIDGMFLAMKADVVKRKFATYRLKSVIEELGKTVKDRQFYDGATIKDNYQDPVEWEKIKQYAIHDGDDALTIFDEFIAPYFYITSNIPKPFQGILYSNSGSQINGLLSRSYLQDGHSLPSTSEPVRFEGAISFGVPGLYKNVMKIDYSALYPSIMRQYRIYDKWKDPKQHFLKMLDYFTESRQIDKKKFIETGDSYYEHLEQSKKIIANSCYGLLGAPGLLFNSFLNAKLVTEKARELLKMSIIWATGKNYEYWKEVFENATNH